MVNPYAKWLTVHAPVTSTHILRHTVYNKRCLIAFSMPACCVTKFNVSLQQPFTTIQLTTQNYVISYSLQQTLLRDFYNITRVQLRNLYYTVALYNLDQFLTTACLFKAMENNITI